MHRITLPFSTESQSRNVPSSREVNTSRAQVKGLPVRSHQSDLKAPFAINVLPEQPTAHLLR